jgi:hypothetical protein
MWKNHPLAVDFTDVEWQELLVAAALLDDFWRGDNKVAPELRLRVAKFATTPEDRARLRIVFTTPDPPGRPKPAAKTAYADLRVV